MVVRQNTVIHQHKGLGIFDNIDVLCAWVSKNSRHGSVGVWLGAAICRPFLATVPSGLTPQEAQRAWLEAAISRAGASRNAHVWHDLRPTNGKRLGAVVEAPILQRLLAVNQQNWFQNRLKSIQPVWAWWLNDRLAQDKSTNCLVLEESNCTTVLAGTEEKFDVAATIVAPPGVPSTQASVDGLTLIVNTENLSSQRARLHLGAKSGLGQGNGIFGPILETRI